jgi:MurNAc alpha-1-phosphate uridylyltransferase
MLPIAILAGGLATRLRPMTELIPKALIEVAEKPFIAHQLNYLQKQGVKKVVICIGYLGKMIQEVVGDGSQWGMEIAYSYDGPILLGTGGALKQALHMLGDNFFVLYGDSYLPVNFSKVQDAFIRGKKLGLMTVIENQNQWDRSNVEFSQGKILDYNKSVIRSEMHHIDYGLGVLQKKVFDNYPKNKSFDLSEVYNQLSQVNQLSGYEVFERFYEIGSHQGILDTQNYLLQKIAESNL